MPSFESGAGGEAGEAQNPFEEDDQEDNTSSETTEHEGPSEAYVDSDFEGVSDEYTPSDENTEESRQSFNDISITDIHSSKTLAKILMADQYQREDPPVPYAMWRDGTSTGRGRTTIELNSDIDELVRQGQQEFKERYGTGINKADLREFALVIGLTNLDDVFEMAEEWALDYDN